MVPHVVKSITDPSTGNKEVIEPVVVRQVISEQTSRKVGEYLEQVVSDQNEGTGKNAYIPGYKIAGKTGTAQKVIDGKYSEKKYVVSFIGYAPVDNPKIVLYVIVDEPQASLVGGGATAAPIFKEIMGKSLLRLGIRPNIVDKPESTATSTATKDKGAEVTTTVPEVTGMTVEQGKKLLSQRTFPVGVLGKGTKVLQQLPKAGSMIPASQKIYLLTDTKPGNVPDLKGFSLRDALEMCSLLQVVCTVEGQGYVTGQKAVKVNEKWTVQLTLAPQGQADEQSDATTAPPTTPPAE
jgi:penicillin-binding protein 2B